MSSATNDFTPTYQSQLRYLVQWFHEWSEMQRNDFLPILTNKFTTKSSLNGIIPGMENLKTDENRPPSLFQCRIKLFNEWTDKWNENEKEIFTNALKSIDEEFMKKFDEGTNSINETNNNNNDDDTTDVIKEVELVNGHGKDIETTMNGNGEHKEEDVELEDNII